MQKFFAILVLTLLVGSVAFGQSAVANVSASVNALLTINNTGGLNLGTVVQGGTSTIASNQAGAATFTVNGAASAATTVTVTFPATLASGANTMTFTGSIPRYNTVNTQGTSTLFGALTGGTANTSTGGALYLWVGGSVTADAAQAAGSYTGTITVAVTQP